MGTFVAAAVLLLVLVGLYLFTKKSEGFESKVIVRYYYLPTCGWCKKFQPEWEKFKQELASAKSSNKALESVTTEEVDGSAEKVPVEAFPTVHLVDKTGAAKEYTGERTAADLMKATLELVK